MNITAPMFSTIEGLLQEAMVDAATTNRIMALVNRSVSASESNNVTNTTEPFNLTAGGSTVGGDGGPGAGALTWDDATWILTCSFIIFTMQSGFGLLEAGSVSAKNEVNIMVKNAVDVIFGGLTYWAFGFGLSFGEDYPNPFVGIGNFFVDSDDLNEMGLVYSNFIFQLSFATTATTIVSGAMAERTSLIAYVVFSLINTVVYAVPAHWLWAPHGWLNKMGAIDIAGSAGVHLIGGVSGLVATMMLGPRIGRYEPGYRMPSGNMTNCVVGMFMLWWGWLGFNCGSTFGISGGKWKLAAKSAVTTINGSMGGGLVGLIFSYIVHKGKFNVPDMVNSILGALVSVTAGCAVIRPWESIIIGMIGGLISCLGPIFFDKLKIDDPVGALSVHMLCGAWGMICLGFFAGLDPVEDITHGRQGLFKGGGPTLLGIQSLACVAIAAWGLLISFILLLAIDKTIGIRMSEYEEIMGADFTEHDIQPDQFFHLPNSVKHLRESFTTEDGEPRRSSFGFVRNDGQSLRQRPSKGDPELGLEPIANGNSKRGHDNEAYTVSTISDNARENNGIR